MAKQKTIKKRRQNAAKRFEAGTPSKYAKKRGIEIPSITFYKDNKISGKFIKPISVIIEEFNKTKDSKLDLPFERKLLNFMMSYGSFDKLTYGLWSELYLQKDLQS